MKKILAILVAAIMIACLSVTAFAVTDAEVDKANIPSAQIGPGKTVAPGSDVTAAKWHDDSTDAGRTVKASLKTAIENTNAADGVNASVLYLLDVSTTDGSTTAKLKFSMPAGKKLAYVLSYNVTAGAWEKVEASYADGTLIGVDDNAICIYTMNGGAVGTMTVSWTDYGPEDNSTVIYGTEGVLRIYCDPEHTLILEKKNGEREYIEADRIQTNDAQTKSGVIDLFVDCLKNPEKEGIPASSVLTAMRAVFAAVESSETGRTVPVNR